VKFRTKKYVRLRIQVYKDILQVCNVIVSCNKFLALKILGDNNTIIIHVGRCLSINTR
jgi:hypothetical protein